MIILNLAIGDRKIIQELQKFWSSEEKPEKLTLEFTGHKPPNPVVEKKEIVGERQRVSNLQIVCISSL